MFNSAKREIANNYTYIVMYFNYFMIHLRSPTSRKLEQQSIHNNCSWSCHKFLMLSQTATHTLNKAFYKMIHLNNILNIDMCVNLK